MGSSSPRKHGPISSMRTLHWRAPTILIGSWILGIGLALAHHFYYQSLKGDMVGSEKEQTWATRIGTGLALVIKALFCVSITTACAQILWHDLQSQKVRMGTIDSLFGMTTNAWNFLEWRAWRAAPLMVLFALLAWMLSFVTIVTPATLTVHLSGFPENSTRVISEPTINYLNASNFMGSGGISFAIATASGRINRLVTSVAAQGRIMALPVPATNASYTSNFFGLSLECAKHYEGIYETAMEKFNNVSLDGSRRTYLLSAFAPAIRPGVDTADPPLNSSSPNALGLGILNGLNATMELEGTRTDPINLPVLDDLSTDTSRFYIITDSPVANRSFNSTIGNFELIECLAYNSSYQVDFNFSNGLQQLDVRSVERVNGISQVSLLQSAYDGNENNVNATCIGTSCGICPYPDFTYLTILKAFGRLFTGLIDKNRFGSETAFATSIRSTVIAQAMEMPAGKDLGPQCGNEGRNEDERVFSGNISMADALEQLMQNVTLSLFSLPSLLKPENETAQIELHVRTPVNIYRYDAQNLLLAYGLAALVTAIAVVIGLWIMMSAHGSVDLLFTTVVRTTRDGSLDALIDPAQTRGHMPVPKSLNDASVSFRRRSNGSSPNQSTWSFVADHVSDMELKVRSTPLEDRHSDVTTQLIEERREP